MTVVGGQDDDAVVIDAGFLDTFHDAADTVVHQREFGIVFGGAVAIGMAHVVQRVDVDETKHRLLVHDVFHAFLHHRIRMPARVVDPLEVVQAQGVGIVQEIAPLAHDAGFRIGPGLFEQMEEGGLGVVFREYQRLEIRSGAVTRDAGHFDGGTVHHGSPVGAARGRKHRPFVQGVAPLLHLFPDERGVPFFKTPGTPAIQADDDDVTGDVGLLLWTGLASANGNQSGGQRE